MKAVYRMNNTAYSQQPSAEDGEKMYTRVGDRIVFDYEKLVCGSSCVSCGTCCGTEAGLHPDAKDRVPTELREKGITDAKWAEWMHDLDAAQSLAKSLAQYGCMYFFPGGGLQYILCCLLCPLSMNHSCAVLPCCMGDWYEALRRWMDQVIAWVAIP